MTLTLIIIAWVNGSVAITQRDFTGPDAKKNCWEAAGAMTVVNPKEAVPLRPQIIAGCIVVEK